MPISFRHDWHSREVCQPLSVRSAPFCCRSSTLGNGPTLPTPIPPLAVVRSRRYLQLPSPARATWNATRAPRRSTARTALQQRIQPCHGLGMNRRQERQARHGRLPTCPRGSAVAVRTVMLHHASVHPLQKRGAASPALVHEPLLLGVPSSQALLPAGDEPRPLWKPQQQPGKRLPRVQAGFESPLYGTVTEQ